MYFLKLYYKLLDWEWYTNANVMRLFIHCLLKANKRPKKWQGYTIERGSFITSYENLAFELGLTVQQIRTAINKLKSTGEITYQSTSQYSIITVKNWNEYQPDNTQNNNQITNEQQTNNKQITTTIECKNDKNEKNNILSLSHNIDARVGKRERDLLKSYCKRNKVQNINAYIRRVLDNGDYIQLLEDEKEYQCNIQRKKEKALNSFQGKDEIKSDLSPQQAKEIFQKVRRGDYGNQKGHTS